MGAKAARIDAAAASRQRLFQRIGEFLIEQRLDPEPGNYAFAYAILRNPESPLARAVSELTDGGVRLSRSDIESLGCEVGTMAPDAKAQADGLVALAQMQVESFDDTLTTMREETIDFGRELAASADMIRRTHAEAAAPGGAIEQVARITAAMIDRVQAAESKLEKATREAQELREKLDEARDNARKDPLTDLANRRAFEETFAQKLAAGETLCVAVCDVDHFKSVNDRFGHAVGDRVLKSIAGALVTACGEHMVARYGGEEFVVLFSGVDAGSARGTLESARIAVENKRYKLRETDEPLGAVTISAGLTRAEPAEAVHVAFQRADALLYRAKDDGRNNVKVG
jgi:diguanylate cyclase